MSKIIDLNRVLGEVKEKLESLHPAKLQENSKPSQHNPTKMAGAKKRLANLYGKLTKGRDESNRVKATGAKR